MHPADSLSQFVDDRQQDYLAAAAAQRLAGKSPARRRLAQSLRRAADRLDASTTAVDAGRVLPGRG